MAQKIRPIVIGLFLYEGRMLVSEAYDPTKRQHFYRPLGGAIEFGEFSQDALRREIREELNSEIDEIGYLGMMENVFTYDGTPMHEIVLVYDARLENRALYEQSQLNGDEGGVPFVARWLPASAFSGEVPVYPEGILEFLAEQGIVLVESDHQA